MCRLAFVCFVVVTIVSNVLAISGIQKTLIEAQVVTRGLSCIKNNPLTLDDINTLKMLKMPSGGGAKCFAACLFKNIGISFKGSPANVRLLSFTSRNSQPILMKFGEQLDNMGAVSASSARQNAKQVFANDESSLNKVEGLVKECEKVNAETVEDGDKGCDRAALAFACLAENGPKYGLDLKF